MPVSRAPAVCRQRRRGAAGLALFLLLLGAVPVAAPAAPEAAAPVPAGAAGADVAAPAAALAAGSAALRRGDLDAGVALLGDAGKQHPIVSDVAALLAAKALLEAGRFQEAGAVVAGFEAQGRPTPMASALGRLRGEAARAKGDAAAAHAAFSAALGATESPEEVAPLLRELALLEEASGENEAAAARWLRLWRDLPARPAAEGSGERLSALGAILGRELRGADDARQRGDRLFEGGLREASLDAYDLALAKGLAGAERAAVQRRRGEGLFGLRRYDEAAAVFAGLPDDPEAEVFHARSVGRGGDVPGAIALLLAQAEKRPGAPGAPARWYAALLLEGEDENARAETLFEAVARDAADPSLRAGAQWRLGFAAWREKRFDAALRQFDAMAAAASEPVTKLQARYWAARARERSGQGDPATEMASLHADAPFTYYGWRAREWLAKRGAVPAPSERAQIPAGSRALSPEDVLRARILVQAELGALARQEIDRLADATSGFDDAVEVATLYREAGAYDRAQQLALKRFGEALPKGPGAGQEALWKAAWPRAFAEPVTRATAALPRLRPPLVFALMREESGFRPAVRSPAGAVGLLQLMPETAARVAADTGAGAVDEDRLTDPATNIRLGTAFLDGLLGRFGGRASAAIGSYNAGPAPVARWLEARGKLADDEWVETIPYEETRNYVKRVQRSLHVYQELYPDAR